MKIAELDLIEVYVYANQIQGLSNYVYMQNSESNKLVSDFGMFAEQLSNNLLKMCEKKIKKNKMSSISFLVLKKELSSFKFYSSKERNLTFLCSLLEKYNFYENVLINR